MTLSSCPPNTFWLSGQRHAEQDHFFRQTLEARGWQPGDKNDWQAAWVTGMPPKAAFQATSPQHKMNHIPGNAALTIKSRLHDSLNRMHKRILAQYGEDHSYTQRLAFFPRAYEMPRDYPALVEDAAANPHKGWILKPTNASKGQGVRVIKDPSEAPLAPNWLVQEYIGNPHTIRGHKYVLRLYLLIAGIEPVRIYLYRQGFAKLASAPWDPDDSDNVYSQLTNPDINALNEDAEVPVEFIDLDRYRQWLRKQGHDDAALFAQIHDLATLTALSGVDAMRARSRDVGADPLGCYELIGLDCLVDDQLKPWILECNLSPSLGICARPEHGGIVEEEVKASLVSDMISLTGLDRPDQAPRQFDAAALTAEHQRAGNFATLYPNAAIDYTPFAGLPSLADSRLTPERPLALRAHQVSELFDNDQLALYQHDSGRFIQLNDSAALIWLLLGEGQSVRAIVEQLQAMSDAPRQQIEQDLWATLETWHQYGLLAPADSTSPPKQRTGRRRLVSSQAMTLTFAGQQWRLSAPEGPVTDCLQAHFRPLLAGHGALDADRFLSLAVLESTNGYCLTDGVRILRSRLHLNEISSAIEHALLNHAAGENTCVIDLVLLNSGQQQLALLAPLKDTDCLASLSEVADRLGATLTHGARLESSATAALAPLNLPVADASFAVENHCQPIALLALMPEAAAAEKGPLTALSLLLPYAFQGQGSTLDEQTLSTLHTFCQQVPLHLSLRDPTSLEKACREALATTPTFPTTPAWKEKTPTGV
ncbi:PqqD family peptide modification chaperone [Halomonas sp. BLK-85]